MINHLVQSIETIIRIIRKIILGIWISVPSIYRYIIIFYLKAFLIFLFRPIFKHLYSYRQYNTHVEKFTAIYESVLELKNKKQ